jgi:hypothetical protein
MWSEGDGLLRIYAFALLARVNSERTERRSWLCRNSARPTISMLAPQRALHRRLVGKAVGASECSSWSCIYRGYIGFKVKALVYTFRCSIVRWSRVTRAGLE